jgi:phage gp29-like protein
VTGLGWQLTPMADATQSEIDRAKELAEMIRGIPRIEDAQYDLTDAIG